MADATVSGLLCVDTCKPTGTVGCECVAELLQLPMSAWQQCDLQDALQTVDFFQIKTQRLPNNLPVTHGSKNFDIETDRRVACHNSTANHQTSPDTAYHAVISHSSIGNRMGEVLHGCSHLSRVAVAEEEDRGREWADLEWESLMHEVDEARALDFLKQTKAAAGTFTQIDDSAYSKSSEPFYKHCPLLKDFIIDPAAPEHESWSFLDTDATACIPSILGFASTCDGSNAPDEIYTDSIHLSASTRSYFDISDPSLGDKSSTPSPRRPIRIDNPLAALAPPVRPPSSPLIVRPVPLEDPFIGPGPLPVLRGNILSGDNAPQTHQTSPASIGSAQSLRLPPGLFSSNGERIPYRV